MSSPLLTLVLPLKGRPLFTLRFLWHANKLAVPYRIIVADGEVHPAIAKLLEDPATFPNLDIEYIRYPDDSSFSRFYAKMADATARVVTPYIMMVDNDDFVMPEGIARSIEFLNTHEDYVSCGGGVAGFAPYASSRSTELALLGPLNKLAYRYSQNYQSRDLGALSVPERVLDGYADYMTTYYNVFRSPAMATICRECVELDFTDLEVHESYFAMRALTMGKTRSDAASVSYLRQYGTSSGSAFKKDWVHHLLRSRFTTDFDAMVGRISTAAAAADGVDPGPIAEAIRDIFGNGLRILLSRRCGPRPWQEQVKEHIRGAIPGWLRDMRARRPRATARARQQLFDRLRDEGAEISYLATFAQELRDVEAVLAGPEFAAFLNMHAPAIAAK